MSQLTDVETELRRLADACFVTRNKDAFKVLTLAADIVAQSGQQTVALRDIYDICETFADGAPDAAPRDRLANDIMGIVQPLLP